MRPPCSIHKPEQGLTLVELIVVVALVGILLGVAVPSFSVYMIDAKRQDGTALLSQTVLRLERCFTLEGVYNGACALKTESDEGYYQLNAVRDSQSYTLSAIPVANKSQANDSECATLSITSTGKKSATGPLGKRCW